jgi:SAM-dependent methyltransferase
MTRSEHLERQRAFYAAGPHDHLRPGTSDRYTAHLVEVLAAAIDLQPAHRVVELGAGRGRFTFPLLAHCAEMIAVDLSPRLLAELERERARRGISAARCRTVCADLETLAPEALGPAPDAIVGFFILHHLPDVRAAIAALATLVAPGGALAFVEPNRRNPLYLAQILCCPDMSWAAEKGLYRLAVHAPARASAGAGLREVRTSTFGFFPPQVINRSAAAARLERRLERSGLLAPLRPFVLTSARRPRFAPTVTP